jgi:TolB-like protein/Tfp pilus assembly protein PilF
MKLLAELKRRNVIRMAGLYLVGAWLVVQVAATLLPVFGAPEWVMKVLVGLLALGFLAALVFSWIYELTPDGLKRDGEVTAAQSIAPQTAQRMDRMLLVVMALALGYFAVDKFVLAPGRVDVAREPSQSAAATASPADATSAATSAAANAEPVDGKSIAVLAFANMSADKDNEYFSDGVAEEILNALAKVDELKVAGRTSSFYFKGRNEPLAVIGSTLGVANVLEGSVRKQGEHLRISAKLLRVSDGVEMWADTFDGTDADIFALQETIAQQVTSELKVALSTGQQNRLVDVGTRDPDAYALYLRATEVFKKRDVTRYDDAMASLLQALQLDPQFARAHSRLATLYYVSATTAEPERYDALVADATASAEQALRLNPKLAEPHALLGTVSQSDRRYGPARAEHQRALELDPADATTNFWHALMHCLTGHIAPCERGLDRTLQIDPLLPNALGWRSRLLVSSGDLPAAQRMVERAREAGLRWPSITLSWIALKRGDLAEARKQTLDTNTTFSAGLVPEAAAAFAAARVGDADAVAQTVRIIDDYLASAPPRVNALVPLTLIRIGQVERGLALFADRLTSNEALFLGEVLGTRLYLEAWASPAFPDFLRKTGIAAYWDEFGAPEHCRKGAGGDYRCE